MEKSYEGNDEQGIDVIIDDMPEGGQNVAEVGEIPDGQINIRRSKALKLRRDGNHYFLETPGEYDEGFPVGTYVVKLSPLGYYLTHTEDFQLPKKLYGNPQSVAHRYLTTFRDRKKSTGVLLCGTKGSGKTLTAQLICKQSGLPVVMVNQPFKGDSFSLFISGLPGECIVFFDEFEKVYDKDDQNGLLTLLDGNYQRKRLFLLTSNTADVSYWLKNRPGRIFYKKVYDRLDQSIINEFASDRLVNKDHLPGLIKVLKIMDTPTLDIITCLTEEMNRFNESASESAQHLNIEIEGSSHDYTMFIDDVEVGYKYNNKHPYSYDGRQMFSIRSEFILDPNEDPMTAKLLTADAKQAAYSKALQALPAKQKSKIQIPSYLTSDFAVGYLDAIKVNEDIEFNPRDMEFDVEKGVYFTKFEYEMKGYYNDLTKILGRKFTVTVIATKYVSKAYYAF